MKVSVCDSATATTTRDFEPVALLDTIRTGGKNLKRQIEAIRQANGEERDRLKKKLPGVMWSGTFSQRANNKLVQHSGLLCADLDALNGDLPEIETRLRSSPHAFAVFVSPSGNGLKAIFRIPADPPRHTGSFRAVEKHVLELTGKQIDRCGKDVARLCFLSHDPEIYFNPAAIELESLPEPEKPRIQNPVADPGERQRIAIELLREIDWQTESYGFLRCPGQHLHMTENGDRDCEIHLDGAPTLHCFHNSCRGIIDELNHELRSRIRKAEKPNEISGETSIGGDDDATITRLAALPLMEYERVRKSEADKLGMRAAMLDRVVARLQPRDTIGLQGTPVKLTDVDPWHEPLNGAVVLDAIAETFSRYVVLPDGASDVLALWVVHAHCYKLFQHSPRLNISSPEKGCGKSTLRDVVALFVPRPVLTENLTSAVLFRLVDSQSPTILADEYDSWVTDNEELRGLLNAGHRQGAMVLRCEGDNREVRGFAAYAPAVLCGIGALPATLHDRSIVVRLERAKRGEIRERFDSRKTEAEQTLCRKLARWCTDNATRLAAIDPSLPDGAFNRVADNWRPLFTAAVAAGGDWPQRCAAAFSKLDSRQFDADSLRVELLADIRSVFTGDRIFSKDLVDLLAQLRERPWPEVCRGKPITERWLARNLSAFGISSKNIRIENSQAKGYELADFDDAFARYLPERGILFVPPSHKEEKSPNFIRPKDESWDGSKKSISRGIGTLGRSKSQGSPEMAIMPSPNDPIITEAMQLFNAKIRT